MVTLKVYIKGTFKVGHTCNIKDIESASWYLYSQYNGSLFERGEFEIRIIQEEED